MGTLGLAHRIYYLFPGQQGSGFTTRGVQTRSHSLSEFVGGKTESRMEAKTATVVHPTTSETLSVSWALQTGKKAVKLEQQQTACGRPTSPQGTLGEEPGP